MTAFVSQDSEAQIELIQREKLLAVGQLAAGIAHEINTPVQFVGDNIGACTELFEDLHRLFAGYRRLLNQLEAAGTFAEQVTCLRELEAEVDVDYIFDDVPRALDESLEGMERVRSIVQALKDFSYVNHHGDKTFFDVNESLAQTLAVARNEIKYVAEIVTEFGDVPPVWGIPGEINQVFLNLLINAGHAVKDRTREIGMGQIRITTTSDGEWVVVSVQDTGNGIPHEIQRRIFEPFFTTKEVGRGTGQGLAISRNIVVDRHQGRLEFETQTGVGTTFFVFLPTKSQADEPSF